MGTTPLYKVRFIRDLKDMVEQSAKLFGNKDAFLVKNKDESYKRIKYTEFKHDIDAFGTALLHLGLKDKHIAVIGENRYEWCVTYLATVNGTGVIVPLDKELPAGEIENLLIRSDAHAIIFSGKYEKEMRAISANLHTVKYFINMDSEEDKQGMLSFRGLAKKGARLLGEGDSSFTDAGIDPKKMSVLIFTSGTTDKAKGVMLSHRNICSNMMSVCSAIYIDSNDSVLSILPLHHTYECTCGFLIMVYNGCAVSFCEGLKHIAKNLRETGPSIIMAVPLILEGMYKKVWDQAAKKKGMKKKLKTALKVSSLLYGVFGIDLRRKLFGQIHESIGGRIRLIISGAAALEPSVCKGFRAMGILVLQGYGLTECSPIATVNQEKSFRDDSIGKALPGVEVKIVNVNSEGIGELAVKGDNVMLGYYQDTLATEKVLRDGWFYTGDLGRVDGLGFFHMTGRQKNVIVTKNGKNIYPEELEISLNKSYFILESLVYGKNGEAPDETLVCAQLVPDMDAIRENLGKQEIGKEEIFKLINDEVKAVNKNIPLYKRIRHFTVREEEFAKTTTKKIKRYVEKAG